MGILKAVLLPISVSVSSSAWQQKQYVSTAKAILKMEIVLIDQSSKCVILTPFSSLTEKYVWLRDPHGKSFEVRDLCEQKYLRFQGMDASLLHSELWPPVSSKAQIRYLYIYV